MQNISPLFPGQEARMRSVGYLLSVVMSMSLFALSAEGQNTSWKPPLGIPNPEFGIKETYRMYDKPENRNPDLTYQKNAEGGFCTHYVDNKHADATDKANPNGSSEKPRKTIPAKLPAGSVVAVHNGPYTISLSNLKGTKDKPIFIRGKDKKNRFRVTELTGGIRNYNVVDSQYMIVENAEFFETMIRIGQVTSHLAFRHCEMNGNDKKGTGIYIWTYKGTYKKGDLKEHLVFYDNHIHHCIHYGFMIDNCTQNVWIVDNHIHHIHTEDGVQIIDRNWVKDIKGVEADRIFIGRNRIYHVGDKKAENAIDAKGCTNVIISQNVMYGYKKTDSSGGEAVRINDEGHQDNIWILFNHIHSSVHGIGPMQSLFRPYIIGNTIHDCRFGISRDAGWVINNTIYDTETAIQEGEKEVANNIIVNASKVSIGSGKKVHHNLIWKSPDFKGNGAKKLNEDPLLADAEKQDFRLKKDSPAIDAGDKAAIENLFDVYFKLYKVDLKRQLSDLKKPSGKGWDVGAHEYVGE